MLGKCAAIVPPMLLKIGGEFKLVFRVSWGAGNDGYATQLEECGKLTGTMGMNAETKGDIIEFPLTMGSVLPFHPTIFARWPTKDIQFAHHYTSRGAMRAAPWAVG